MTSRNETQKQTRTALLEAGVHEVLLAGIHKASIRTISAKAGYTLGAFYSNFSSRNAFLLAVLDSIIDDLFASLDGVIDVALTHDIATAEQDIAAWIRQARQNNMLSRLLVEFTAYAGHDEAFRAEFIPYIGSWRGRIALSLDRLFKGFGLTPSLPLKTMAAAFSALWQGLTLESLLPDTEDSDRSLIMVLDLFLKSSGQDPDRSIPQ